MSYIDKHQMVFEQNWNAVPIDQRTPKIRKLCWGRAKTFLDTENITLQNQKPRDVSLTLFKEVVSYMPDTYKHSERILEISKTGGIIK